MSNNVETWTSPPHPLDGQALWDQVRKGLWDQEWRKMRDIWDSGDIVRIVTPPDPRQIRQADGSISTWFSLVGETRIERVDTALEPKWNERWQEVITKRIGGRLWSVRSDRLIIYSGCQNFYFDLVPPEPVDLSKN